MDSEFQGPKKTYFLYFNTNWRLRGLEIEIKFKCASFKKDWKSENTPSNSGRIYQPHQSKI